MFYVQQTVLLFAENPVPVPQTVRRDNGPNLQRRNTETETETAAQTAAAIEAETEERNGDTSINTNTEGLIVQGDILYNIFTREIQRERHKFVLFG